MAKPLKAETQAALKAIYDELADRNERLRAALEAVKPFAEAYNAKDGKDYADFRDAMCKVALALESGSHQQGRNET